MKKKSFLGKFNVVLFVVFVVLLAVVIYKVSQPLPVAPTDSSASSEDVAVIDAFVAGTYGGKQFDGIEDVVNYYNECYDYTKTLTAQYTENGETKTYYKLVAEEKLDAGNVLVEGKANSLINDLVPTIVNGIFSGGVNGLPPSGNRNPDLDKKTISDGSEVDCRTSALTADDVLAANVKDNNDGTITITIQPKAVILSMPCEDAQGRFFNTLGDISSTVEKIEPLSFSQGSIDENFVVDYKGGTGVITIDTATGEITKADYVMKVHIDVKHANVLVLKDKSASLDITYTNTLPASDKYLKETKGLVRA